MSLHDGTSAGSKSAEAARKPFVVERYVPRNMTFSPITGRRYATYEEALAYAESVAGPKMHIVTFNAKSKPTVVWESK